MKSNKPTLPTTQPPSSSAVCPLDPETASMRRRIRELTTQVAALEAELRAMRASSSWRVSAPLRWLGGQLHGAPAGARKPARVTGSYQDWVRSFDRREASAARAGAGVPEDKPGSASRFSILVEGGDASGKALADTLESLRNEDFAAWELLVVLDAFESGEAARVLPAPYLISGRARLFGSSEAAAAAAGGEWLLTLTAGDRLAAGALDQFSRAIAEHPESRFFYADDDQLDAAGQRSAPRFKPDWNRELVQASDIVTPGMVVAKTLVAECGGWRPGAAAAYELALRCTEVLEPARIHHIPRILVHRSSRPADLAQPTAEAQALAEHLKRTCANAQVETTEFGRRVRYALPADPPMVSLIVPTRNGLDLLRQCVSSIVGRTRYPNYEILVVDNGSDDPQALAYLQELRQQPGFTVIRDDRPFNFSALNNLAARSARGEVLGLINNDIEVISPDWLDEMVALALQPGIGAVGAKLLYPDESIQHGGVLLGVGGIAGHANRLLPANEPGYMNRAMLTQCFSAVTAACLVVRKQLYDQVGGLDEVNLKIAYNDVDFCLRLRAAGHRTVWTPYAELFHHESATRGSDMTPEKRERFEREQSYMRSHWGELIANDPAYNPNLALDSEDFSLAWPPRVPWISGGAKP